MSCSLDGTVRVWRSDPAREMLLYPWFKVYQVIEHGSPLLRNSPASVLIVVAVVIAVALVVVVVVVVAVVVAAAAVMVSESFRLV